MTVLLVLGLALCASATTMAGGLLALKLAGRAAPILGFCAGAVIGVAFFDLAPEAIAMGQGYYGPRALMAIAALGFFLYVMIDQLVAHHDGPGPQVTRGLVGATSFCVHSLMDGFIMGIALQAGSKVGLVVAAAVLAHDFADGLNTVNVVTSHGGSRRQAQSWLILAACAPILGAALSLLVNPVPALLAILLALFCGFFLHIGASSLLPESRRAGRGPATMGATLAGAGLLYMVTRLAG
jgi:ZIP family zinc transporter